MDLTSVERFMLLLLFAPVDSKDAVPITGDIWLQKELFAVSRLDKGVEHEAGYEDFRFGSFSEFVEVTKDQYESSGYIKQGLDKKIFLTAKGIELARKVWAESSDRERELARDVKRQFNDMGYWELLVFMYGTYPEMAKSSQVKPEVLEPRRRLASAISLYKKGKVSVEKASELSGMHLEDFVQAIKSTDKDSRVSTIA